MAVKIKSVKAGSPAFFAGIGENDSIVKMNNHEIVDVLDYRFFELDSELTLTLKNLMGEMRDVKVIKEEGEELGLEFDSYLMDNQKSCKNKCIFCFIDQLPKGMRESLYFKDDDSRMSFLFGNYITLTNITEHEVERIIKMHISPVNVSVHTTNPDLRVKMMNNRFAGESLCHLWRLAEAGIDINCQLVLCPDYNDGEELKKSISDLIKRQSIKSIAVVPVGLTAHREGLAKLRPFTKSEAKEVIKTVNSFGDETVTNYGERRVFAADEFYILAGEKIPSPEFYEEFAQLENGVGMWALTKRMAEIKIEYTKKKFTLKKRKISVATGEAAYPLIKDIVDRTKSKWHNLTCEVYPIKNEFFGGEITVTGLVTGTDIINQLKGKSLGTELIIPSVMLRHEKDKFLDDTTIFDLEKALGVRVRAVESDGADLVNALINKK